MPGAECYRIGSSADVLWHGVESLLLDRHGLASRRATERLVDWLRDQRPQLIGLHNIHGYYLNYPILFDFLGQSGLPVVWTLHDCWPFTGHCAYFDRANCEKWKTECSECPLIRYYPKSLRDRSNENFRQKKALFSKLANLTIVTPSEWLHAHVKSSFLSGASVTVIRNGVDLDVFHPLPSSGDTKIVLGVASEWSERKGLQDFLRLRSKLPAEFKIVLLGVTRRQRRTLPAGIVGVPNVSNLSELAAWYQRASVFVNPTYGDNFPTTNIESLASGTPVVTYDTGGSPEAVDEHTGQVVRQGDIDGLVHAIRYWVTADQPEVSKRCRQRAVALFDHRRCYEQYVDLFESIVQTEH